MFAHEDLASYKGWLRGRIGGVERAVYRELSQAKGPLSTAALVQRIYLRPFGRYAAATASTSPKAQRWMYLAVRRAAPTYAVRIGKAETKGSPVLWMLKPAEDISDVVVRDRKMARYTKARKRRKHQAYMARRAAEAAKKTQAS